MDDATGEAAGAGLRVACGRPRAGTSPSPAPVADREEFPLTAARGRQ